MKLYRYIGLVLVLSLFSVSRTAAQGGRNNFAIENDNVVLYLDLKLKKEVIDSMLRVADIKVTAYSNLLRNDYAALLKDGWEVKRTGGTTISLTKPLTALVKGSAYQMLALPRQSVNGHDPGVPVDVAYGINKFYRQSVRELDNGLTRFFLRGNLDAKRVILSGSFNSWNTTKGLMLKTDSGWISDVKLEPGQQLYKFIVNGNWINDKDNQLRESDGYSGFNSIYYRYNYMFKLTGYANAARVMVAGSFNNWNANEMVMAKKGTVWQMPIYLKETLHTYRFMIDGKWITDPANPKTMADGKGSTNSVLQLGPEFGFKLVGFASARNVFVAGSFNNWKPGELRMKREGNAWRLDVPLNAGNYGYKFIVDGNWMTDPLNPCYVGEGGETNSLIVVKPNYTFTLKGYDKAKTIRLSGTFNNWSEDGYTLAHQGNVWTLSLNLKTGKHLYKFIVDGNWILDPGNKLWEQNEMNTGNSVLWLEP
jgi:type 1 glutamine amidotransferase